MAKKKVPVKKVKPTARKAAPKKPAVSKPAAKNAAAGKSKATVAKAQPKAVPQKSALAAKPAAPSAGDSLGRPLVTQEEKLYMLFHDDYEARQVFEFLRVETVADLVQLTQEEIVKVLTAPVRRTIQRIRQRLAEKNRSLHGDEEFTRQHKARLN